MPLRIPQTPFNYLDYIFSENWYFSYYFGDNHPHLSGHRLSYKGLFFIAANVKKWERSVQDDEKELDKVRKDESRHMKVITISQ